MTYRVSPSAGLSDGVSAPAPERQQAGHPGLGRPDSTAPGRLTRWVGWDAAGMPLGPGEAGVSVSSRTENAGSRQYSLSVVWGC